MDQTRGNVARGYFTHPEGHCTWIDPNWRWVVSLFPEYRSRVEQEIDRRIRIVAMGA